MMIKINLGEKGKLESKSAIENGIEKELPPAPIRSRRQCIMKIQKCNIDERNKIEVVNSETARGEAWGTGGAGTRI